MRHNFLTLLALLATAGTPADEESETVLARMSEKIERLDPYRIEFAVSAADMGSSHGEYFVDGKRYRISVDSQSQFSDGNLRYEVNDIDKEVTVDRQDTESRNILQNPTRAFDFSAGLFDSKMLSTKGTLYEIELIPAEGVFDGVSKVVLKIDKSSGLPTELRYNFDGSELIIAVESIRKIDSFDESLFIFDPERYKEYEIISFI